MCVKVATADVCGNSPIKTPVAIVEQSVKPTMFLMGPAETRESSPKTNAIRAIISQQEDRGS